MYTYDARGQAHTATTHGFSPFCRFPFFFIAKSQNENQNYASNRLNACIHFVLIKSHCSQISNLNHRYCACVCVWNSWRNHPISFKYIVRLLFSIRFVSLHFLFVLLWRDCAHYRDDLSEKGHIKYISVPYLVYHCMVMLRAGEREREREISVKQTIKIMKTWRKR